MRRQVEPLRLADAVAQLVGLAAMRLDLVRVGEQVPLDRTQPRVRHGEVRIELEGPLEVR